MVDKENSKQNKESKLYISKDEHSKNSEKETPKKTKKIETEKEKNIKKINKKSEYKYFNEEKNKTLNSGFINKIMKKEKI